MTVRTTPERYTRWRAILQRVLVLGRMRPEWKDESWHRTREEAVIDSGYCIDRWLPRQKDD